MAGPIPEGFFQTSEGMPHPAAGGSDATVTIWAVGHPAPVRTELGLGLDTTIFQVRVSALAYPGYLYVVEMTPAEPTTPIEVPTRRYGVASEPRPPAPEETTLPAGAPTLFWYWPARSPLARLDPEDSPHVTGATSPVWYVPMKMVLWRRRVYCEGTPLYLEARWTALTGETIVIKGGEHYQAKTHLDPMHGGFTLLKALEARGGRPYDTRYYTREEFHARYLGAMADASKRRDGHITDEHIARAFPLSLSTFYRYVRKYGRPLPS
jgi:hypothetical protein